jgi:hypothetical protein
MPQVHTSLKKFFLRKNLKIKLMNFTVQENEDTERKRNISFGISFLLLLILFPSKSSFFLSDFSLLFLNFYIKIVKDGGYF